MKFTTRNRRRQAPTIIIISLIDILIVLLIFLMVTTTFKQQPSLKLALPESKQAKTGSTDETENMVVTVAKEEPYYYLGGRPVTLDRLQLELNATAEKNPNIMVSIWSDQDATIARFMKAWDAAAQSGLRNVRMVTKKAQTQ